MILRYINQLFLANEKENSLIDIVLQYSMSLARIYKWAMSSFHFVLFDTIVSSTNNHAVILIFNSRNKYCRSVGKEYLNDRKVSFEQSEQEVVLKKLLLVLIIYELMPMILLHLKQVG